MYNNNNNRKTFSLIGAARADEDIDDAKRFEISSIDSYGEMNIEHLNTDLEKYFEFPQLDKNEIIKIYGRNLIHAIPHGYKLSKKLGSGAFGTTFSICKDKFNCSAIKIVELQDGREELKDEIILQRQFHDKGLAPAIIGKPTFYKHKGKGYGVINMEKIDGVLDEILSKNLQPASLDNIAHGFLYLVHQLDIAKYAHRDAHPGNIGFTHKRDANGNTTLELSLIDFGHSNISIGSWPEMEILQFLRSLSIKEGSIGVTTSNQKYLWDRLLAFYQNNFNDQVETEEEVDEEYDRLFDASKR